jgi:hypothetical protein
LTISSKSPVNGLSAESRTASGRASSGEAVSGIGASAAEGLSAVVVAGGVSCWRPVQAVAAVVSASRATPPRRTPDRVPRVFIVVIVVFQSISRLQRCS